TTGDRAAVPISGAPGMAPSLLFLVANHGEGAPMTGPLRELTLGARRLAKSPGFTATVLLTLALGMGANTAIFSFIQGVLLRPLPYPQPESLVSVCETNAEQVGDWCAASPANAADWAKLSRTLESIGLARSWLFAVKVEGKPTHANTG